MHEVKTLTQSGAPTLTLNHDAKGNLVLTAAGQTLAWDVENRLASASSALALSGGGYQYDALGRRLSKTTGGVTTRFIHDGEQIVAEYENGTLKRRYVYGTYIDEPLARLASSGTLYYHQNRIYSVMALSNQSGQLAERYGYTPYGKRRVVSAGGAALAASAVGNQVGFTDPVLPSEPDLLRQTAEVAKQPVAATLPPPPLPPPSLLSSPASTIAPSVTPALAANSIRPGSATSSRNAGRNTTNIILGVVAAALFVLIGERLLSRNAPAPTPAPAPAAVLLPPPTVTPQPAAAIAPAASPQIIPSVAVPPPVAMPIASAAPAAPAPPAPIAAAPTAAAPPPVRATPRRKRSERPAPSEPTANIDGPSSKPADATPKAESTAKPEPSAAPAKPSGNGSRAGLFDEKWWQ